VVTCRVEKWMMALLMVMPKMMKITPKIATLMLFNGKAQQNTKQTQQRKHYETEAADRKESGPQSRITCA
jgi:hypothetical protein